tara:strand:- start:367 stop:600 length:234 start_codon:yes stop_codon:yes gene_type:complete
MAIKHRIKFNTEVVNGVCPQCHQDTILVSVVPEFYRCSLCGEDLKQHVNGKISYIPTMHLNDKERNDLVSKNGQTEF